MSSKQLGAFKMMRRWLGVCLFGWAGICLSAAATDDTYESGWGPALHRAAPDINAPDQHGTPQTLETLAGRNGLLLLFVRSADW